MTRTTLTLLCGIPGSGKSFLTGRLAGKVVSTDAMRKFLWGNESVVEHDRLVFDMAKLIIDYVLSKKVSAVLDATNLTRRRRQTMIDIALRHQAGVTVVWIDCPLEVALARNAVRDRKVPVPVIKALYKSIEEPDLNEGINIIKVLNADKQFKKIICPRGILIREKYLFRQEWPVQQRIKKIKI
ncbi:MAG: AAA family ATPase [Bacillota bacterium]